MNKLNLAIFLIIILMQPCMSFAEDVAMENKMEESYLCITDEATGFKFNKSLDKWESANFKAGRKFLVGREPIYEHAFVVREVGEQMETSWCKQDFDDYGYLHCTGFALFNMSKISLRFILVDTGGYIGSVKKDKQGKVTFDPKEHTSYMSIGKCSSL